MMKVLILPIRRSFEVEKFSPRFHDTLRKNVKETRFYEKGHNCYGTEANEPG
jgi:hypothetical protein